MAIGYRAAARIPAFTAEEKAASAATTTSHTPTFGRTASAAVWMGTRSPCNTSGGTRATVTRTPRV